MKIIKIKKTKNDKYKLELDNDESIVTYGDVILKSNLLYNQELDFEKLSKLYQDTNYYDVYNKVIKFISKRLRSEKEIIEYLDKLNFKEQKEVIESLKKLDLINDKRFAKAYFNDRLFLSNDGPKKITNQLIQHNIDIDLISNLEYEYNKEINDKLNKIIIKKIKNNTKYSNSMLREKVILDLINKGYDKQCIAEIYELNKIENDNISKDYDKLIEKLSLKYSDNELMLNIKNKLYQKGYTYSEIKEIIDKKNSN